MIRLHFIVRKSRIVVKNDLMRSVMGIGMVLP